MGRPHLYRAAGSALRRHGQARLLNQHDRRNWNYLNQALQHGLRHRSIKTNPAADVLLPEKRAAKQRKSFTIEQAQRLLVEAIPADTRPAMWLTGLMCGLRPGELAGLRWCLVEIDSESPSIRVTERALEVDDRYAGQVEPKTPRSNRCIGLHPLLVAALQRHRDEMRMLGLYDEEGFVFCSPSRRNEQVQPYSSSRAAPGR